MLKCMWYNPESKNVRPKVLWRKNKYAKNYRVT